MPSNQAFGLAPKDEQLEEKKAADVEETDAADEEADFEDGDEEEMEDSSDEESEEDEGEDEPVKPLTKEEKKAAAAAEKAAKAAAKKAKNNRIEGMEYGLGDVRIDRSIPLSQNAVRYMNLLLESPLTNSMIPPDFLNEESEHTFCIQSLRFFVPKGKIVRVPMLVAEEIRNSFSKRI